MQQAARYVEHPPPAALAERVACVWLRSGAQRHPHRVLPDGCVDLVWTAGRVQLVGAMTRSQTVPADAMPSAGVRLRPGAARLLGIDASELVDLDAAPSEAWGRAGAELERRLVECQTAEHAGRTLLDALARRLERAPRLDPAVREAVAALEHERTRVGELGRELYLSERQLRRRFLRDVGLGPALYARVARLHRLLTLSPRSPAGTTLARLAVEAGYSDESHLARDVRQLAGITPSVLLREHAPLVR